MRVLLVVVFLLLLLLLLAAAGNGAYCRSFVDPYLQIVQYDVFRVFLRALGQKTLFCQKDYRTIGKMFQAAGWLGKMKVVRQGALTSVWAHQGLHSAYAASAMMVRC